MEEGQGFARRVTEADLARFAPLLKARAQRQGLRELEPTAGRERPENSALAEAEALFEGTHYSVTTALRRARAETPRAAQPAGATRTLRTGAPPPEARPAPGPLLWSKPRLPASDVQSQAGNPTGGLRLTQAGWTVNGQVIDQTSYFRYEAFGGLQWSVGVHAPMLREVAVVPCYVTMLGQDYGLHDLAVSHKPSGEAGQGNYTTMLHWRDLAADVQGLGLVGRTFLLYGPPQGEIEPFFIDIV